jgi:hypothetical protein
MGPIAIANPIPVGAWDRAISTPRSLIMREDQGDTYRGHAIGFILVPAVYRQSLSKILVSREERRVILTNVLDSPHAPRDSAHSASGNSCLAVASHGVDARPSSDEARLFQRIDKGPNRVVCHEHSRSIRLRVTERETKDGPAVSAMRSLILSHREPLGSKAVVVKVAETPGQSSRQQRSTEHPLARVSRCNIPTLRWSARGQDDQDSD